MTKHYFKTSFGNHSQNVVAEHLWKRSQSLHELITNKSYLNRFITFVGIHNKEFKVWSEHNLDSVMVTMILKQAIIANLILLPEMVLRSNRYDRDLQRLWKYVKQSLTQLADLYGHEYFARLQAKQLENGSRQWSN